MKPSERPHRRPWTILESSYAVDRPFLKIRSDRVQLPNGMVVDEYFVQESRGFSVIFAVTPERDVVLVRQYKHGAARDTLELPAGAIDAGERPEACAVRELVEETGYTGDPIEFLADFSTNPTGSNGRFYLYLVRNARRTSEQKLDVTEAIDVELLPYARVLDCVRDGTIDGTAHVLATLLVNDRLVRNELSF